MKLQYVIQQRKKLKQKQKQKQNYEASIFEPRVHDHPLILNDQAKDGDSCINCNGCLRPVSGETYECRQCDFVIHKSCVELPKQIIHFFHPQHPLTLLSKSPFEGLRTSCDHCDEGVWGFFYRCSICDYDLDIKCVQLGQIVNHQGHQHSFMVHRPTSFTCDICEETSNGMCYMCSTCQLWVHKHCAAAALPISDSIHTFNLPSTFPTVVEDLQESRDAASGEEQAVSLEENDMLSKIQHFSHPCQLILTNDEPQNEETCDELENEEICDEPQNAKICNGCVRPISTPFYKCARHRFFLHPPCAQLPTTIRSILHPHPLTLRVKTLSSTGNVFQCSTCLKICTGFAYECKLCNFYVDARCASISKNTLKHDGHEHILSLVQKESESSCDACGGICRNKFSCEDCDFNLDLKCALLPLTARLGWDEEKHPLKLTFVNVEHISKFYFCDLCEEVRNPDDWYYCCKECDRSAHTACLFGKHDVKFGATYTRKGLHDHSLKLLAEKSKNRYRCKSECDTDNKDVVLECPTCDYHTHVNLADTFFPRT